MTLASDGRAPPSSRAMDAARELARRFGRTAALVADAPGRVNLIGEHTDYNGGVVLPTAVPLRTEVAIAGRDDECVRIATADVGIPAEEQVIEYRLGEESRRGRWSDYVQGCTAMLAAAGHPLRGFDAAIVSRVPAGAGLSSSAALEVALLRALRTAGDLALDDVALARVAHRAEHDFVGARVGTMDQMAASLADTTSALFLDTRSLAWERVALPADLGIAVIDSGVTHEHAAGDYNLRRAECERAAALLDVDFLTDLGVDALMRVATLPAPLARRARHVVTENARVHAAVTALRAGDLPRLGALLAEGHASLRDDFEVSTPAIDRLVALAAADPDVLGARLTGGGFGGAVVLLIPRDRVDAVAARVAAAYEQATGQGRVLVPAGEGLDRDASRSPGG